MNRKAEVKIGEQRAGVLLETESGFEFIYDPNYSGPSVSLTMPVQSDPYKYASFPPFFEGLLPEGGQLEALLRRAKLDRSDLMGQLLEVGADVVGNATIIPMFD